jgi:ribulose-5-phosphate 4-epimerase/fuculose-1-phosphate aldolase
MTNKRPTKGQGHLHYRVDNGPVIATTTTKLSFHELTPGKHQIVVMLANNDHSPAGPQQTLEITVP